jgi:hypothetical protein
MMVYHSTEIAGFHFEPKFNTCFRRGIQFISWKTSKTPERGLENKLSWLLYFTWFSHTLSALDPEWIRHSLAPHSGGSELKSRYRDRLPWGFFNHCSQIRRMHIFNNIFHKMQRYYYSVPLIIFIFSWREEWKVSYLYLFILPKHVNENDKTKKLN